MSGKYLLDTCFLIGLQNRYPDALILATAKVHGLTLLTLDQRLEALSLSI